MNTASFINTVGISPHMSNKGRLGRWFIALLLIGLPVFGDGSTRTTFWQTLSEAYIAVTVFVALTLLIFYSVEHVLKIDTGKLLEDYKHYQIPLAAVLGALPGCGGAIMVMTQYSIGRIGFGGVVAVLTSTMGDAAFLLLATEPTTGLAIIAVSVCIGTVFGYIVEAIHGYDFLAVSNTDARHQAPPPFEFRKLNLPWLLLLIPGIAFGFLTAFQTDVDALLGLPGLELWLGVTGAILSLALWFINPSSTASVINRTDKQTLGRVWDQTTTDTCFVTVWVIIAFLLFEMTVLWTGWDLKAAFGTVGAYMPLVGVLIGFLPGCGPQVLTTGLYLQGVIPLSAQLANSISNDGDALFPALAIAPRASIIATLYTAIPALLASYGYYVLVETSGF
ncbi:MAG: putative manganese transporter [Pseudomonadota bacterium]